MEKEEKGGGRERGGKRTTLYSSSSLYLSVTIKSSHVRIMEIPSPGTRQKTRETHFLELLCERVKTSDSLSKLPNGPFF